MEDPDARQYPLVVIGGSAGALDPLTVIVSKLPAKAGAYLFVAIHISADAVSNTPAILGRAGEIFAAHALDRAPLVHDRLIVAPPDRHLTIEDSVAAPDTRIHPRRCSRCRVTGSNAPISIAGSVNALPGEMTSALPNAFAAA